MFSMQKLICLNCGKRKAQYKKPWGYLPCKKCQKNIEIGQAIELTTDEIKTERKVYASDIEQRYVGGVPNLNYVKLYGTKGFTKDELTRARAAETSYYIDKSDKYNERRDG